MSVEPRIVAIGASAGGIEALRGFLRNMPPASGAAIVIVLHLSPQRASLLPEVLGRWTEMPVQPATDGAPVLANHVHVIPPGTVLTIEQGHLRLSAPRTDLREAAPIDVFFGSLAADQGADAIGIVLSGTGSDGALGLKAIKEAGGIALAQGTSSSGPQFGDMPAAAISTGSVDLVLPVEDMPRCIMGLLGQPEAEELEPTTAERLAAAQPEIASILRSQVGHDFSGYKEQTFLRRVDRRMQLLALDMPQYIARLKADPNEVALLFRDLLIGVTSFFRDSEIFAAVEQTVVPMLFRGKGADTSVRVWVPGCATGEEAYSLAILLREHMTMLSGPPKVQIFATDIDETAIGVARLGRYPTQLLQGLSPARLARFFSGGDGSHVISKDVRDLCTFSSHSVIRDPPFSRMDMISCRNLLIYLDNDVQARVIPAFHYSLVPDGVLILGGSEAVSRHAELFSPLDKRHRIFQRRNTASPPLNLAGSAPPSRQQAAAPGAAGTAAASRSKIGALASQRVLERFAPNFVVVDADLEVLHFSGGTGKYLEPATGSPSSNVIALARRGLKAHLRTTLREAIESGRTVERHRIEIDVDGGTRLVALTVEPLRGEGAEQLFLVVFAEVAPLRPGIDPLAARVPVEDAAVEQMERELREAREQVQATAEDYEAALEELKSTNEEMHSVNEELQSSNEELETSKEEIQSMNEELQTVNAQLHSKLEELDRTYSDLNNLFASTQVATVFLDRFLIVRGFTPAVSGIYNLIPSDHGRPLTDIASQIDYSNVADDTRQVLDSQVPLERRVMRNDRGAHYLMRVLPYRAADNTVDGALITFVDVTSIVRAEEHHRLLVDEMNHRVRNMLTVVTSLAAQTLRRSPTLDEFSEVFTGRLHALSTAYTLLTREKWTQVPMRDVMTAELLPYLNDAKSNIVLNGPQVQLRPKAALALGMAVHELATNAVKYGALKVPEGEVRITWHVDDSSAPPRIVWRWQERHGPPVTPPRSRGFGLTLIERSLSHELNGRSEVGFTPEGLVAELAFPIDAAAAVGEIGMRRVAAP